MEWIEVSKALEMALECFVNPSHKGITFELDASTPEDIKEDGEAVFDATYSFSQMRGYVRVEGRLADPRDKTGVKIWVDLSLPPSYMTAKQALLFELLLREASTAALKLEVTFQDVQVSAKRKRKKT